VEINVDTLLYEFARAGTSDVTRPFEVALVTTAGSVTGHALSKR
jgi:hypothetical protein